MNNEYPKPDFICVGPHKTGTAWLFKTLSAHKEVKKSIVKELDYFLDQDIKSKGLIASLKYRKSHLSRVIKRRLISKNLKKIFSSENARRRIEYHLRIIFGRFSFKFYSDFFQKEDSQIVGDISPAYFALGLPTIQKIKENYPNIKILLFLREPVSRMSSHLKMMHAFDNISLDELKIKINIDFLKKNNEKGLYPYQGLQNWLSVFGEDQIFIGFYDEFKQAPVSYYQKICKFLKISDDLSQALNYKQKTNLNNFNFETPEALLKHRYNSSKIKMKIPDHLIQDLCKHYYKDVELLANFVDSPHPKKWLEYYNNIISELENET